jgi:hypothetical protein
MKTFKFNAMKRILLVSGAILFFAMTGMAQRATPGINNRQVNQQARIRQGVQSGELTCREAAGLEAQQAQIRHQKRVAKADGVVTPRERSKIHRSQRRASRSIAYQKHDDQGR